LARVFNLNRDKVTISTDSRYVLWYLMMVLLTFFFKQWVFLVHMYW
jgi:hypothetical protein